MIGKSLIFSLTRSNYVFRILQYHITIYREFITSELGKAWTTKKRLVLMNWCNKKKKKIDYLLCCPNDHVLNCFLRKIGLEAVDIKHMLYSKVEFRIYVVSNISVFTSFNLTKMNRIENYFKAKLLHEFSLQIVTNSS